MTEHVRRRPYSVVLFDEIEKGHPDVFNVFLQILDDGRLTDGKGRTVDFKNVVIIMTSNVGSHFIQEFGQTDWKKTEDLVMNEMQQTFRPEFLNRVDDVILFHALSREHMTHIVEIQLKRLMGLLKEQDLTIKHTDAAKVLLGDHGYDPVYGARPLKRVIQKEVQNKLAKLLLGGKFLPGDTILLDAVDDELVFEREAFKAVG